MAEQQVGNWQPCKSPASWLSDSPLPSPFHDLKCDTESFDIPKSLEYQRSLAGSPFESSDSESDSSSDSGDDASSMESENLSLFVHDPAFSRNECSLYCCDIEILTIVKSNALGLEFTSARDILDTREFLTVRPQAGSLRAPLHHQDDHSYGISNQWYHAWQEHLAHQPESQAEETLVSGCPQDICLRANVRNTSGSEVSRHGIKVIPVDEEDISGVPSAM